VRKSSSELSTIPASANQLRTSGIFMWLVFMILLQMRKIALLVEVLDGTTHLDTVVLGYSAMALTTDLNLGHLTHLLFNVSSSCIISQNRTKVKTKST
jgi:hypothetical protein